MTNTGVDHIATCVIYLFTYLFIYLLPARASGVIEQMSLVNLGQE